MEKNVFNVHVLNICRPTGRPNQFQLNTRALKSLKVDFDELRTIVVENDKQRFSLILRSSLEQHTVKVPDDDVATAMVSDDPAIEFEVDTLNHALDTSNDPADFVIRANQGHSLTVDVAGLLEPISLESAPSLCVHGTTHHAWPLIMESGGLKRMTRTHVHFAPGLPEGMNPLPDDDEAGNVVNSPASSVQPRDAPVISGMRSTSSILVYIDLPYALSSGLRFYRSENGVLLCAGEADTGVIPLQFFERVEERRDGHGILMRNGQVVKESPAHWRSGNSSTRRKTGR